MNSLSNILHTISYMALPLFVAMVFHEFAHGWVANYYGDPTAKLAGRLTLDPRPHIDLFGTILLPLMCLIIPGGFFLGWAKPVPVNAHYLRNPREDMAKVAIAGPAMNLILAIASALLLSLVVALDPTVAAAWPPKAGQAAPQNLQGMILLPIAAMALYSVFINVLLMVFNLIPIPPLDGGRVLVSLLPHGPALAVAKLEPYGMFILVGLMMLDPQIHIIHTLTGTVVNLLAATILTSVF
jgi:Zn-dependent protease